MQVPVCPSDTYTICGVRINEATRWLEIPGTGFSLQTSDLAKVALVIYLARVLAKYQNELTDFRLVSRVFHVACGLLLCPHYLRKPLVQL
jgi:cell division protein FtsW